MKFSSLTALEVVKMTTSSAASDENFIKMTTFSFQCVCVTKEENSLNPEENGRRFADEIFQCNFLEWKFLFIYHFFLNLP